MAQFEDIGGKRVTVPNRPQEDAQRQRERDRQRQGRINARRRADRNRPRANNGGGGYAGGGGYDAGYVGSGSFMGGSGSLQAVIDAALAQRGIDYSWGGGGKNGASYGIEHGASIRGFDCSGLLQYAFYKGAGIDIGGTSAEQRNKGVGVSKDQMQAGDLIYWNRPGVSHIAMYLGNGYMIEAPRTGAQVRVIKVGGKNSIENATSIRRIIQGGNAQRGSEVGGGEFERLVYGIRDQESDHRYDIVGARTRKGNRAYGAYQIMDFNIPGWTQEVLGRRMTPQEFLADREAQDKVARAKLRQLYDKYGAAAAAAGWFGGEGAARSYATGGNRHDPVAGFGTQQYAREVLAKMQNAPAPLGGSLPYGYTPDGGGAGSAGGFGADLDRMISEDDMEAAFASAGYSSFVINSDAELKQIFKDAVKNGWNQAKFSQAIKSSKWYRGRSDKQREFDTLRLTDPKTWGDNLRDQEETIRTVANSLGVTLTGARLTQMAKTAYRNGFTEGELQRAIAAEFSYDPKSTYSAEAGNTINNVRDLASSYGVMPTKDEMGRQVKRILAGQNTIEGLRNEYIQRAKSTYSHFSTEFDAGRTLEDIANPYRQTMAQVLEMNPEDINIHDNTIKRGLARKDPKSNATGAMALWEYEEFLKNDDRWMQTGNARESMMTVGSDLLRSFGLKV